MFPNPFAWLKADPDVTAIIGTDPCRVYEHGSAPQGVVAPYVTHFVMSGLPENCLDDPPPIDKYSVQVDCWSDNSGTGALGIKTLAKAVRNALEPHGHLIGYGPNGRDPDTQRYRIGFIFDFWHPRN